MEVERPVEMQNEKQSEREREIDSSAALITFDSSLSPLITVAVAGLQELLTLRQRIGPGKKLRNARRVC